MQPQQYQSIYNDIIASRGAAEPVKNLVRKGMPKSQAEQLVAAVYKDIKWEMRKVHLWKVIGSGAILAILGAIALFSGRVFFIWIGLAGLAFVYSLVQCIFAVGVDVDDE
jgi:fatty-acid desaturase